MKMPKTVYVRIEYDKDEPYLVADFVPSGEHGDKVGVYILKEERKLVEHKSTLS